MNYVKEPQVNWVLSHMYWNYYSEISITKIISQIKQFIILMNQKMENKYPLEKSYLTTMAIQRIRHIYFSIQIKWKKAIGHPKS